MGEQRRGRGAVADGVAGLLPPEMPHLFRAVLAAMAQPTVSLSESRRKAKKHRWYRPRAFPSLLARALAGERVPLNRLKHALRYRQVDFYADAPLTLRDDEAYVEAVRGLADGCQQLGIPVTGGNVSFYNQTGAAAIHPTPVVGVLGVLDDVAQRVPMGFAPTTGADHDLIFLLGETRLELSGSEWAWVEHKHLGDRRKDGAPRNRS